MKELGYDQMKIYQIILSHYNINKVIALHYGGLVITYPSSLGRFIKSSSAIHASGRTLNLPRLSITFY